MKPDDGYISYIVNPKSGARCSKMAGRRFEEYLVKKGFPLRVALTTSLDDACEFATAERLRTAWKVLINPC
jgi:hypothetical protein